MEGPERSPILAPAALVAPAVLALIALLAVVEDRTVLAQALPSVVVEEGLEALAPMAKERQELAKMVPMVLALARRQGVKPMVPLEEQVERLVVELEVLAPNGTPPMVLAVAAEGSRQVEQPELVVSTEVAVEERKALLVR